VDILDSLRYEWSDYIGSTPARVHRPSGTVYLNSKTWNSIPAPWQRFILLHEAGHAFLNTSSEVEADHFAFQHFAGTEPMSLKNTLAVLANYLNPSIHGHSVRLNAIITSALAYDANVNRNDKAKKLLITMQDDKYSSFVTGFAAAIDNVPQSARQGAYASLPQSEKDRMISQMTDQERSVFYSKLGISAPAKTSTSATATPTVMPSTAGIGTDAVRKAIQTANSVITEASALNTVNDAVKALIPDLVNACNTLISRLDDVTKIFPTIDINSVKMDTVGFIASLKDAQTLPNILSAIDIFIGVPAENNRKRLIDQFYGITGAARSNSFVGEYSDWFGLENIGSSIVDAVHKVGQATGIQSVLDATVNKIPGVQAAFDAAGDIARKASSIVSSVSEAAINTSISVMKIPGVANVVNLIPGVGPAITQGIQMMGQLQSQDAKIKAAQAAATAMQSAANMKGGISAADQAKIDAMTKDLFAAANGSIKIEDIGKSVASLPVAVATTAPTVTPVVATVTPVVQNNTPTNTATRSLVASVKDASDIAPDPNAKSSTKKWLIWGGVGLGVAAIIAVVIIIVKHKN